MRNHFVPFDDLSARVSRILETWSAPSSQDRHLYLVRDLVGKVRISVSEVVEDDESWRDSLHRLATSMQAELGPHAYPAEDAVLFVDAALLEDLDDVAREIRPGVHWVDRLVTGRDWWQVTESRADRSAIRYTLYSVKGGVGRSTTAAVLARYLARNGERVLVVDLDLESPGLSAMLDPGARPEFGVTDWFVEDLVGQDSHVVESMTASPSWSYDFDGEVQVVPAHGREAGEYLAKLGRVYLDTDVPWAARLERLVSQLEQLYDPTLVLLESRSGVHDIAAATVTALDAQVFLFAVDAESHWTDYGMLFQHWQANELATKIRERLAIVSALTPELDKERYLQQFRERAWNLFRDYLYDDVAPSANSGDEFSFDLAVEGAPHDPLAIHWNRGLAAGASLRDPEWTTVDQAYVDFFTRFDDLLQASRDGVS